MKKILSIVGAFLILMLLLYGCSGDSNETGTSNHEGENWTVLVYLCGTDLEIKMA